MYVDPATVETVSEMQRAVAEVAAEPPRPSRDVSPAVPDELRVLADDVRRDGDHLARRSLAVALLARGWAATTAGAASGLGERELSALDRVQRPGTAASSVADDLVSARGRAQAS